MQRHSNWKAEYLALLKSTEKKKKKEEILQNEMGLRFQMAIAENQIVPPPLHFP